jgi:hypothetical protein
VTVVTLNPACRIRIAQKSGRMGQGGDSAPLSPLAKKQKIPEPWEFLSSLAGARPFLCVLGASWHPPRTGLDHDTAMGKEWKGMSGRFADCSGYKLQEDVQGGQRAGRALRWCGWMQDLSLCLDEELNVLGLLGHQTPWGWRKRHPLRPAGTIDQCLMITRKQVQNSALQHSL